MQSTGYVGAALRRVEDPRLITGRGQYVDDLQLPGTLSMAVVRSPVASARITRVDIAAARRAPGVVGVLSGADMDHLGSLPTAPVDGLRVPRHPLLARTQVRFVGEAVAVVVAEDVRQARDAAELVQVQYEQLPVVTDVEIALQAGAPVVHAELGDNIARRHGVQAGEVGEAFARAERVVALRIAHERVASVCMEPRGVLAAPKQDGGVTLWCSTQTPFLVRDDVAAVLGLPADRVRVIAPDVGGGFGAKVLYREDALAAFLALRLGRPTKWVATRIEDMLTTQHGRDMVSWVEAAVAADGRILALRARTLANMGAYLARHGAVPTARLVQYPTGTYRIPNLEAEVVAVFTNTAPTGPYRGAGRPEATFLIERVVDEVARELKLDPAEVRRRNFVGPDEFPYTNAAGVTYDSGNYAQALDRLLESTDYPALRREQAERRARGELVGIGLSTYTEVSGGGWESGSVRVERDGSVTAVTGSSPHGQGHETTFAQIVTNGLGVPFDQVLVCHGDTAVGSPGVGTYGSRSMLLGGSALYQAALEMRERVLEVAAGRLEASPRDLTIEQGRIHPHGVPERALSLGEVAQAAYADGEAGLEVSVRFQAERDAFPFGAYLALVRVEQDTGRVVIERLVGVDDCGTVINPLLVEGQVHGAVAQGIGESLLEQVRYDESGQLLTSSLLDYAVPKADEVPTLVVEHTVTPSPLNPLGAKGVGEAGTVGSPPAVANAVVDALSPLGVRHLDLPITAETVWRKIQEARAPR